ncbi:hypothetical protein Xinn_04184 [Xenorhabdus innexi]|uniref:Uncharacterized protein n=1 Tax=Xenorhabdus innexi TaxID=290109 RepID=A0A2G0MHR5_9GAMM|nr:hypothetical protein Xinn_04184 [Xenorhabdus innexi]
MIDIDNPRKFSVTKSKSAGVISPPERAVTVHYNVLVFNAYRPAQDVEPEDGV